MPRISAPFCPILANRPISQKNAAATPVITRLATRVISPRAGLPSATLVMPSPNRKFQLPFPNAITAFTTERMAIQSNQLALGLILARAAADCNLYVAWGSYADWPLVE